MGRARRFGCGVWVEWEHRDGEIECSSGNRQKHRLGSCVDRQGYSIGCLGSEDHADHTAGRFVVVTGLGVVVVVVEEAESETDPRYLGQVFYVVVD